MTRQVKDKHRKKTDQDKNFALNWAVVKDWSEEDRYSMLIQEQKARDLIEAIIMNLDELRDNRGNYPGRDNRNRQCLRHISRLRKQYGQGRWRKLKGVALIRLRSGSVRKAELHWYEAHGIGKKEIKRKCYAD